MKKTKILKVLTYLALSLTGVYLLWPQILPLNPSGNSHNINNKVNNKEYVVMGFLPHWNYRKLTQDAISTTTHLAYFSLKLQGDGSIQKLTSPTSEEPGWTTFKKITKSPPELPLIITFSQANNDQIEKLLNNSFNRKQSIKNIIQFTSDYNAAGINIDIEPSGGIAPSLRANFTNYIQELSEAITISDLSLPSGISIDIYATSASRKRLWDLEALTPFTKHFVAMAYDYHQTSSSRAGPNSPLRGTPLSFNEDVLKNISEIIQIVPPEQILLGIPFYGYEWTTVTADKYSTAITGAVASIDRVQKMIEEDNLTVLWDRNSLTPYIIFNDKDDIHQIYFENTKSIELKIQLVKQAKLGGIAIWALGYEGDHSAIWDTIKSLN